jgi:hypothetical protein
MQERAGETTSRARDRVSPPGISPILKKRGNVKANLESTSNLVEIVAKDGKIQARVWEGKTEAGVPFVALICRLALKNGNDASQFEAELKEMPAPASVDATHAFPLRMII